MAVAHTALLASAARAGGRCTRGTAEPAHSDTGHLCSSADAARGSGARRRGTAVGPHGGAGAASGVGADGVAARCTPRDCRRSKRGGHTARPGEGGVHDATGAGASSAGRHGCVPLSTGDGTWRAEAAQRPRGIPGVERDGATARVGGRKGDVAMCTRVPQRG